VKKEKKDTEKTKKLQRKGPEVYQSKQELYQILGRTTPVTL